MHADDDVNGIFGDLDPNYVIYGSVTKKSDVYRFVVLLLVFLIGKKPDNSGWGTKFCSIIENGKAHVQNDRFNKVFYSKILGEGVSKDQARPDMIDVAKEPM